jgi:hypothetical protein
MQDVFTRTERQGGFQRLVDMVEFPPEGTDKPRLRVAVLAWRHRRRASRAMFEIEHRDDLAQLKATDREDFLGWLGMEAAAVTQLHATEGYKKLSQGERDRLDVYVGGGTSLSANAVTELEKLLADSKKDKSKAATFNKFLHDQKGIAELTSPTPELRLEHMTELSGPVDVKDFKFARARPTRCAGRSRWGRPTRRRSRSSCPRTRSGRHAAAVHRRDRHDDRDRQLAHAARDRAGRANPGRNPQDAFWASTKGMANFRSFMTAGSTGSSTSTRRPARSPPGLRSVGRARERSQSSPGRRGATTRGPEVGAVARGDAQGRLLDLEVREDRASPTTSPRRGRCSWRSRAPSARRRSRS